MAQLINIELQQPCLVPGGFLKSEKFCKAKGTLAVSDRISKSWSFTRLTSTEDSENSLRTVL